MMESMQLFYDVELQQLNSLIWTAKRKHQSAVGLCNSKAFSTVVNTHNR